jgi:hypothetical protein
MYPTTVETTPFTLPNAASTPQKHPAPNVAVLYVSVFSVKVLSLNYALSCGNYRLFRFVYGDWYSQLLFIGEKMAQENSISLEVVQDTGTILEGLATVLSFGTGIIIPDEGAHAAV